MKKLFTKCIYIFSAVVILLAATLKSRAQTVTEYFEGATFNAQTFTNTATGVVFDLTNQFFIQDVDTYGVDPHTPPTSNGYSSFYIDDFTTQGHNQNNAIKTHNSSLFTVKSLYMYPSSLTDGSEPTTDGLITFIGKKGGVQQFSFTKAGIYNTVQDGISNFNYSGFTFVDFSAGTDKSNVSIDELEVVTDNTYLYVAIDNFQFAPAAPNTPVTSTTSISTNLNPSFTAAPNNFVTFTAIVTSSGNPVTSGTVSFTSNGTVISGGSNVAVNSSGQAVITTNFTAAGAYTILATYSGNSNFATSSQSLTQQVNLHPTTISSIIGSYAYTNAATLDYTVTFATALTTPPSISDFSLTGTASGTINSVTGSGTTYDVNVTGVSGNGPLELDMTSGSDVSPTVSNVPFAGYAYNIDNTAPTALTLVYKSSNANQLTAIPGDVVSLSLAVSVEMPRLSVAYGGISECARGIRQPCTCCAV